MEQEMRATSGINFCLYPTTPLDLHGTLDRPNLSFFKYFSWIFKISQAEWKTAWGKNYHPPLP